MHLFNHGEEVLPLFRGENIERQKSVFQADRQIDAEFLGGLIQFVFVFLNDVGMTSALRFLGWVVRRPLLVSAVKPAHGITVDGGILAPATRASTGRGTLLDVFIQRFERHCFLPIYRYAVAGRRNCGRIAEKKIFAFYA